MDDLYDEDEKECNTCKHYDVMDGVCKITGEFQHGYDECHTVDKNENLRWELYDY